MRSTPTSSFSEASLLLTAAPQIWGGGCGRGERARVRGRGGGESFSGRGRDGVWVPEVQSHLRRGYGVALSS